MPPIDRPAAKKCVEEGLTAVADFSGDCESFTFEHWHGFHKSVFINAVATRIARKGSRIVLNEGMLGQFSKIGEFIDFVKSKAVYMGEPKHALREQNGDLG